MSEWESFSCVWLFATPWTIAHQAPLSMGSPGKNAGMGCHFLPHPYALGPLVISLQTTYQLAIAYCLCDVCEYMCVCVCVCARARARVCALFLSLVLGTGLSESKECWLTHYFIHSYSWKIFKCRKKYPFWLSLSFLFRHQFFPPSGSEYTGLLSSCFPSFFLTF